MYFNLKNFDTPITVTKLANIHYFEFTEKYHTEDDAHDFCELVYVDKGRVMVHSENYFGSLMENQLILHLPNEVHSLKCTEDIAPNIIIIGFECKSHALIPLSQKPVSLTADLQKQLVEIMQEGLSVYEPPYDLPNTLDMQKREVYPFGADQMIKLKMEMFLINMIRYCQSPKFSENSKKPFDDVASVYKYINEHYYEKISLDTLCFLFGTNKTTLCQYFKNEYGETVVNYINSLKVKEAKKLLRENKKSVTQISEFLGFNSVHYFCRIFKKVTGTTPKEYIKTVRSKLDL